MAQGMVRSPLREAKFTGTLVTINKLSFLIPNDKIVKIFDISKITEVPNTSQSIVGVINFQGEVISVIDISKLLCDTPDNKKMAYSHDNIKSRAIILEFENEKVALFVDEILEFLEIDKTQIIRTLTFENLEIGEYLFQGAIINEFEQIVLVLNVDYLHKHLIVSEDVEDARNAVVMFENHHFLTPEPRYVSLDEGLLIEDSGNLFLIDSRYVSQVIVQESFLMKKYEHSALLGAAIHWGIGPLINFNNLITESNLENSRVDKSIGILLHHPDSGFEATFLIENILGRKSTDEFEVYQPGNNFSSETISPIISGFFSYQGKLGIIINPSRLLEETTTILKDIIGLEDPTKDFVSTLLPEEKEFLENIQAKRKENQLLLLLEKQEKGTRYDYFALKWQNNIFAIDITFVDKVISPLDIKIVKTKDYPIVGIAKVEEEDIPILDLASIFLDEYKKAIDFQDKHFFIFKNHNQSFVIPVDSLEGVITVFKYELLNCDQSDHILKGKDYCKYKITNKKDSSTYLVENEFLKTTITQDGINSLQIEYKKSEE